MRRGSRGWVGRGDVGGGGEGGLWKGGTVGLRDDRIQGLSGNGPSKTATPPAAGSRCSSTPTQQPPSRPSPSTEPPVQPIQRATVLLYPVEKEVRRWWREIGWEECGKGKRVLGGAEFALQNEQER
ncbi:hypothetical protein HZH68_016547 [Vespula germanica]|uniref:Uncharacterized protein n=1 Tax=Vespula germanica TaxID=30212 RepID=A0A834J4Y2_VESGE|nr:hypothetical protein HZH68_016547 [Vespula germanica]